VTDLFTGIRTEPRDLWPRRALMGVFTAVAALALWGFIGQPPHRSVAEGNGARMVLEAPEEVRGGLYFQATVDITTQAAIEHPRLVLDEGWVEGMQVNSIEPAAESEVSRDGRVVLTYGALDPGDRLKIWFQFQVDPTNHGRRSYAIELDDETRPLVRIDRELTVLP
jgi:hypothetical protein